MALETAFNWIANLVNTNPANSDQKAQGAAHLRGIKNAVLNSFAGYSGGILCTGTDTGAANAYVLTPTPALFAYTSGLEIVFTPITANTGVSTVNVSGLGLKTLKNATGGALVAGDLPITGPVAFRYDGTDFILKAGSPFALKTYVNSVAFSSALPDQTGNATKYVRTNGTTATWDLIYGTAGGAFNWAATVTVASGSGTFGADFVGAASNDLIVSGTTAVTALGTAAAGVTRKVKFTGILTLTYNATSLILPGLTSITTAANDTAQFTSLGSGNWICDWYSRASGLAVVGAVPALVFLSQVTATAASTVDIETTFDSTYDEYLIVASGVTFSAATSDFAMRLKVGGAYDTGSNYTYWAGRPSSGASGIGTAANASGATSIAIINGSNAGIASDPANVRVCIHNPSSTALRKLIDWDGVMYGDSSTMYRLFGGGMNTATTALTGVRFFPSSGTMTGKFRLYGIKNS